MKNRVLSLLLTALLLSAAFVACAGDGDAGQSGNAVTTTVPETTIPPETEPVDTRDTADLPTDVDMKGFTLRILSPAIEKVPLTIVEIAPEKETGETLNDAIYNRNELVYNKYGIKIEKVVVSSVKQTFANASLANSDDFEVAINALTNMAGLAADGHAVDLMSMKYLDLTKNYWDQDALEALAIDGKMFYGIGDVQLSDDDGLMVMLYNSDLAKELELENLYTAVDEGRWTYDLLLKYVKQAANDIDSNGVMDKQDRIGYMYASNNCFTPHAAATQLSFYTEVGDGSLQLDTNVEKLQKLFEILNELHDPTQYSIDWLTVGGAGDQIPFITSMVSNKQVLFQNMILSQLRRNYPDVTADFGILPMPKLNEQQNHYYTTVLRAQIYVLSVPVSNIRLDQTGYALEAMAEASGDLSNAYYEICLASKYTRDPESYDMIKLAREHIVYDPGYIYNWGKLYGTLNNLAKERAENVASTVATLSELAQTEMDAYIKAVRE